jgi:predicted transcriptional regulator
MVSGMSERAGKVLRDWRSAQGLSQATLAEMLDTDQPRICKWERGYWEPTVQEAILLDEMSKGAVPVRAWRRSESRRKASRMSRGASAQRRKATGRRC